MTRPNLADFPFYRARLASAGTPEPWTVADLEQFAADHPGDPFAGRVRSGSNPKVALQIEATGEPPVWSALDVGQVDRWAQVLARMWHRWGLAAGETIAFFDYGSSPLVLLASSSYMAYLKRGAADRLGVSAICNDGVATMAARMVGIIESVKPSAIILRRDLLAPFAAALDTAAVKLTGRLRWAAVTDPEGAPTREELARFARIFGVPTYRVLRADAAFLLAGECPECRLFHLDRAYRAESVPASEVAITTVFAQTCPAVRYNLGAAELIDGQCSSEPRVKRIACN